VIYWASHLENMSKGRVLPHAVELHAPARSQEKKSAGDEHGRARIGSSSVVLCRGRNKFDTTDHRAVVQTLDTDTRGSIPAVSKPVSLASYTIHTKDSLRRGEVCPTAAAASQPPPARPLRFGSCNCQLPKSLGKRQRWFASYLSKTGERQCWPTIEQRRQWKGWAVRMILSRNRKQAQRQITRSRREPSSRSRRLPRRPPPRRRPQRP
jgi:hypothetical protein